MISYRKVNDTFVISGVKLDKIKQPAIGAVVQVYKESDNTLLGETVTQIGGYWSLTIPEDDLASGKYIAKFYGSRLTPKITPEGDWELFDVMGNDLFTPIEPADIQGLLRETITVIDDSTVLFEYAVGINATRISISNVGASSVTGLDLTRIYQHKNPIISTDDFDPAYDLTDWNASPALPLTLAPGETVIIDLTTSLISAAYKVKLVGTHIGDSNLKIKITSRLAADEIDAGRIRVEKGISISDGSGQGVVLDTAGIYQIDGGVLSGEWLNSPDGDNALFNLGNTGTTMSPLWNFRVFTDGSVYIAGELYATSGGFGGTPSAPKVTVDSAGLIIKDADDIDRVYVGVLESPAPMDADGWRDYTDASYQSSELVTNGSFESALGAEWVVSNATYVYREASTPPVHVASNGYSAGSAHLLFTYQASTDHTAYQEFSSITANTTYTIAFDVTRKGGSYQTVLVELLRYNGVTWDIIQSQPVPTPGTLYEWRTSTLTYFSGADTNNIRLRFTYYSSYSGWDVAIDQVSMRKYEYFTDINQQGVFIFNSPSAYIKIGKGKAEFKGDITASDLIVENTLTVYGTTVTVGPSIVTAAIQILNDSGDLSAVTYAGLELDNTSGANPMLVYDVSATRWRIGTRTSTGDEGAQTGTFGTFVDIITTTSTDTLTNKTLTAPVITAGGNIDLTAAGSLGIATNAGANNITIGGSSSTLVVPGNLTVSGTLTWVDTTNLRITDKNIELAYSASPSDTLADGGGITLKGTTDKTILWDNANDNWSFNQSANLSSGLVYKINNTSVLSATTLGSGVTASSLTSVGTIGTGVWQGTTVASGYGGTGFSTYTTGDMIYASATNTLSKLAIGATNTTLQVNSGIPTWVTNPTFGLTTVTSSASSSYLIIENSAALSGSNTAKLIFRLTANTYDDFYIAHTQYAATTEYSSLGIYSPTDVEIMRFNRSNFVGISNNLSVGSMLDYGYRLYVAGSALFDGALIVDGAAASSFTQGDVDIVSGSLLLNGLETITNAGVFTGTSISIGSGTITAGTIYSNRASTATSNGLQLQTASSTKWLIGSPAGTETFYIRDVTNSNTVIQIAQGASTGVTVNGWIYPYTDNASDLGSASYRWNDVYSSNFLASTAMFMGGTSWMDSSRNLSNIGTIASGAITTTGTLAVNASGGITTNQTTFPLVNATATTVNFAGAATALNIGGSSIATVVQINSTSATPLILYRAVSSTGATPAQVVLYAQDASAGVIQYVGYAGYIEANTAGAASASAKIAVRSAGTVTDRFFINNNGDVRLSNTYNGAGTYNLYLAGLYNGSTQVMNSSRNLLNIGTITSGLINGQTISSTANFTGSITSGVHNINTTTGPALHITTDGDGLNPILQTKYDNTTTSANGIVGRRALGTSASPLALTADVVMMGLYSSGRYDASNWGTNNVGAIRIVSADTFSVTSQPTYIDFAVTPTGAITRSVAMVIKSNGDVVLGTTPSSAGTGSLTLNNLTARGTISAVSSATEGIALSYEYVAGNSSSRVFYIENSNALYGFSTIYAGNTNPTLNGTAFTLTTNKYYLIRHDNSATGAIVYSVDRTTGAVDYQANTITTTGTVTTGALAVNSASGITTNQTTFSLINTTATTINFAGAATALNIGAAAGTTNLAGKLIETATLNAATGNEVALTLNYTVNKATSGNDTGLLINMTDTASPGTSRIVDLSVGAITRLYITPSSLFYSSDGTNEHLLITSSAAVFGSSNGSGNARFEVTYATNTATVNGIIVKIGDEAGINNSTQIRITDSTQLITLGDNSTATLTVDHANGYAYTATDPYSGSIGYFGHSLGAPGYVGVSSDGGVVAVYSADTTEFAYADSAVQIYPGTGGAIVHNLQHVTPKYTTTTTLDWSVSNVQYIQLANGGQTFTFANAYDGGRYMLIVKQPSTGAAGTITWPGAVLWSGGVAPTLTATNNKVDVLTFVYDGTNTKYYGDYTLNY